MAKSQRNRHKTNNQSNQSNQTPKNEDKKIVSSQEVCSEKGKSTFNIPQPLIVKEEKEKKKGFTNGEKIAMVALLISIASVLLNKLSYDNTTKSLNIADSTFKISLKKDSAFTKQFEMSNRPILQIGAFKINSLGTSGGTAVSFRMINLGKFPATIVYSRGSLAIGLTKTAEEAQKEITYGPVKDINTAISSDGYIGQTLHTDQVSPEQFSLFRKGKNFLYMLVEVNYENFGTKQKYRLTTIHKIGINKGDFDFEGIKNIDTTLHAF